MNMHINDKKKKAILVDIVHPQTSKEESQDRLEELESLVNTYGGIVVVKSIQKRSMPNYDTYVGSGKLDEIEEIARENKADILIINNILKPRQLFNLEERFRPLNLQPWDRVELILKIFSKHAKTTEAQLQIELASIKHMGPRIYKMGGELMQQTGALGLRSGQGETNIELMKRHLRKQELAILDKLKHYDTIRAGHRKRRKRNDLKTIALIGYTNAGKSSLLKALTQKDVYVADELFATLDTRVAKLYIPGSAKMEEGKYVAGEHFLLSDTIGFIQDLPPFLIEAFKSTLMETIEADFLLHVIDVNDPKIDRKISVVEDILTQLGLEDKPRSYVFNKVDLIAHTNFFEDKDPHRPVEYTLVKAGKDAPILLGWLDPMKNGLARKKIESLGEKYDKFSPVFVSAEKKMNLPELIENLQSKTS